MSKKKLAAIIAPCVIAIIAVIVTAGCQGGGISILNPYQLADNRYNVQLHAHSTNSDGVDNSTALVTAYRDAGYDALAITDHDYLTPDPGVSGILHIPGVEETAPPGHIVNLFATSQKTDEDPQEVIDDILLDGGLTDMAHYWRSANYFTVDILQHLTGYQLMEIANGGIGINETAWDFLLTEGMNVWAIGVDDCHNITSARFNKYFVEIMADELSISSLEESLGQGNFYVRQTGAPQITVIVSSTTVTCNSSTPMNTQFIGKNGIVLKTENGVTQSTYTIQGWEQYVRIKAVDNATATYYTWSQPVCILY